MMKLKIVIGWFVAGLCSLGVSAQQSDCISAIQAVSQDSLVDFVNSLTGRKQIWENGSWKAITSRQALHPDNIIAGNYIKQTCINYGFTAEDIPFSATGRNVVMYKPGTINAKKAYILSAHYDCVGSSSSPFQGADDNASGAAAILEAARVLQNTTFPYTIILAFWDEEEIGLKGSEAFAPDGPIGFWDVQGVINLDMIGYDGNQDSLGLIHTFPVGNSLSLADKLVDINQKYAIGLKTRIKNPGETATDHQSFWVKGATAIGLTEDYDFDFSPHWHQLSDSIENMHLPYFTQMSTLAIATICELSKTGSVVGNKEIEPINIQLYPNPTSEKFTIQLSKSVSTAQVELYNSIGDKVLVQSFSNNSVTLSIPLLPIGLYWIVVSADGLNIKSKIAKTE
jgi:Zn-dependent M28 family amino/carboxypeptidase